jgi:hypothetical protein
MKRHLALFQSTRAVIKAERLCKSHGIRCSIIPVPRTVSSECGMAIEIDPEKMEILKGICLQEGIEVETAVWEKGR